MSVLVEEPLLRDLSRELLEAGGLPRDAAVLVADVLLFAELRGIPSHGVVRLPYYLRRLRDGGTEALAAPVVIGESPGTALIDARNGMGHVACMAAADLAAYKAGSTGTACVGVRGSSHNGALSYYAMKLAERGFAAFVFTNTTPLMAPWGGTGSVIGNNPLAFAAPFRPDRPFVFDAAMSSVAAGRVRLAASRGERIPRGWIVDETGRETEDPRDFERGALLPFAGHKGYGFALIVEILASVLTGAGMLHQNPFWQEATDTPLSIGHSIIAMDIARFMPLEEFGSRMEWMASVLESTPAAEGSNGVILPGEFEHQNELKRLRDGIPLAENTWVSLREAALEAGVDFPDLG